MNKKIIKLFSLWIFMVTAIFFWKPGILTIKATSDVSNFSKICFEGDNKIETKDNMESYVTVSCKRASYCQVLIKWKRVPSVKGYNVYQGIANGKGEIVYKKIAKRKASASCTVTKRVPWDKEYYYIVCPFVKSRSDKIIGIDSTSFKKKPLEGMDTAYTLKAPKASIKSLKASGNKVTIKWIKGSEVESYDIFTSTSENGPYKLIKNITNKNTTSLNYKKGVTGDTNYFKVVYNYPYGRVAESDTNCIYLNSTRKVTAASNTINITQQYKKGQYANMYNSSSQDKTFYYKKGKELHVVTYNAKILDYIVTPEGSTKLYKSVDLGRYNVFGGFLKGTDENYYVVVGNYNPDESKKKTVIKIMKYDCDWKPVKTCNIKGGVTNVTSGIYVPFDNGNCRMDMEGDMLYLTTCRQSFAKKGERLQSNIDFVINTKSMKLRKMGPAYVSSSYNQFVKIKNNSVYLANHGNNFLRCLQLTVASDFFGRNPSVQEKSILDIMGEPKEEYTGLCLGGLDVGKNSILVTGISVPQNYTIDGITGNSSSYKRNVFLSVTDRKTLDSKLVWITSNNPEVSGTTNYEVRMVKISDTRFALLYTSNYSGVDTLNYVLVSDQGKVLSRKTYDVPFSGCAQPIIYDGAIVWTEVKENGKRYICQIPVK